ncbi:MAG: hypothetical protein ABIN95_00655 [Mucilaginibacter sp.]
MKKYTLLLLLLIICFTQAKQAKAQTTPIAPGRVPLTKKIQIEDGTHFIVNYFKQFGNNGLDKFAKTIGLTPEETLRVYELNNPDNVPEGIKLLTSRQANLGNMQHYNAYLLGKSGGFRLIYIPKKENLHMPQDMQPLTDEGMFLVYNKSYLSENITLAGTPFGGAASSVTGGSGVTASGVQYSTADMSGFDGRLGVMLIYYGFKSKYGKPNTINSTYIYTVSGKQSELNKDALSAIIAKKVYTTHEFVGYEWLPGYDYTSAVGFYKRKTGSDMGYFNGGSVSTNGGAPQQQGAVSTAEEPVVEAPYAPISKRSVVYMDSLYNAYWSRINATEGSFYTTLDAVKDYNPAATYIMVSSLNSEYTGKVTVTAFDMTDAANPIEAAKKTYTGGGQMMLLENVTLKSTATKIGFAITKENKVRTAGALAIYMKLKDSAPVAVETYDENLKKILASAATGFMTIRNGERKDADGNSYSPAFIDMDASNSMIYQNLQSKNMTCRLEYSMTDNSAAAAKALTAVIKLMGGSAGNGQYTRKEGMDKGYEVTEYYNRAGKQVLKVLHNESLKTMVFNFY